MFVCVCVCLSASACARATSIIPDSVMPYHHVMCGHVLMYGQASMRPVKLKKWCDQQRTVAEADIFMLSLLMHRDASHSLHIPLCPPYRTKNCPATQSWQIWMVLHCGHVRGVAARPKEVLYISCILTCINVLVSLSWSQITSNIYPSINSVVRLCVTQRPAWRSLTLLKFEMPWRYKDLKHLKVNFKIFEDPFAAW